MPKQRVQERAEWRWWVTPKLLADQPVHRWFIFPHSFSAELVHALIKEFNLGPTSHILDPFCGAGTTLVAAKEKGVPATGHDLSPFAAFVSETKLNPPARAEARSAWLAVERGLDPSAWNGCLKEYPDLVKDALPGPLLGAMEAVARTIDQLPRTQRQRDFLRLALLAVLPKFSRAVPTGGWLKWRNTSARPTSIPRILKDQVDLMLKDLPDVLPANPGNWHASVADVRHLPEPANTFDAVITSPPYPNRHDYTRVFGVELMFDFLDWEKTRQLRYQSFHSHPEARPERNGAEDYQEPPTITRAVAAVTKDAKDPRIPAMLRGYFVDMFLTLRELCRVCRPGGRAALVLGNAQYCGTPILVDRWTAEIADQAGLECDRIVAARLRGNSAQQMGEFGIHPSRESVVILRKPNTPSTNESRHSSSGHHRS